MSNPFEDFIRHIKEDLIPKKGKEVVKLANDELVEWEMILMKSIQLDKEVASIRRRGNRLDLQRTVFWEKIEERYNCADKKMIVDDGVVYEVEERS